MPAKVAKVLNSYSLVINKGSTDGVKHGDRYVLGGTPPCNVYDPETGELLGAYSADGLKLKATDIYDRCAVLKTVGASGGVHIVNIGDVCERESS